ncbi:hypothetical protein [Reichenbachiella versicolor]|uniref:hypothetical protein n=1 Tax=Reichenbachiella versicolor TaxID=1821036 RepID=UPI000D6E3863|nr:hypothetical protein [Reichenbachiella versicolor]
MNLEDLLISLDSSGKKSLEDSDIDSDSLSSQIERKKLESKRYESDTKDRKWLAIWTATIVSLWLLCVILILVKNESSKLDLSDTVLVTLLGTTTLNVLGLPYIVLKGHFASSSRDI